MKTMSKRGRSGTSKAPLSLWHVNSEWRSPFLNDLMEDCHIDKRVVINQINKHFCRVC